MSEETKQQQQPKPTSELQDLDSLSDSANGSRRRRDSSASTRGKKRFEEISSRGHLPTSFLFPSGSYSRKAQEKYSVELFETPDEHLKATASVEDTMTGEGLSKKRKGLNSGEGAGIQKTLGWWGAFFNMVAYAIALGVLSIPLVAVSLGVVPFVLLTIFFAYLCWYVGIQYWKLKQRFPGVQNLQDAGHLMFGKWGGHFLGFAQLIFSIFLQGNHVLLGATAFHILGWHSCAVGLAVVFAFISFLFTLPRSYTLFSISAFISFTSIVTVVIIAMIASGISGPTNAPPNAPPIKIKAFGPADGVEVDFLTGFLYTLNLFVSFGAIPGYLPIMSEMRKPKDFPKSMAILVACQIVLYLIVGGVIYNNLGQYTLSPSLNSLSPTMSKVAYGLGLPTILIAGCESGQVAAKHLYIIIFRSKPHHIHNSTKLGWLVWILINVFTWTIAFVLAECIPFFSSFLGLEAALFWALFNGLAAVMWLFLNQGSWFKGLKNKIMFLVALIVVASCSVLCVVGMWSSVISIRDAYAKGVVGGVFSCQVGSA
ncbi:hypothetical protein IE53DRAFT_53184 [Violaceomyces palustris]|uniref:Uncharacterized protein n=1 Tax=Violaceomyces palustris TaxID=1673888 RepID=A0ACD0NZW2_9BASI|nr:hypothetical protein IE53DRAFT_53184 [Violaceomyces palustris]